MTTDRVKYLLTEVDQPREPDQTFSDRLLDRLLDELTIGAAPTRTAIDQPDPLEEPTMNASIATIPIPMPEPWRDVETVPWLSRPRFRHHKPVYLAAAALLALLIGGGALTASWLASEPDPVRVIPAVVSDDDGSPANAAMDEMLIGVSIDSSLVAATEQTRWNFIVFEFAQMDAQTEFPFTDPILACCPGVSIFAPLDGQLIVLRDAPLLVMRAGGVPEAVEPSTEVRLEAGDAVIFAMGKDDPGFVANRGSTTVNLLAAYLVRGPGNDDNGLEGYFSSKRTFGYFDPALTEAPFDLVIDRMTLNSGEQRTLNVSGRPSQIVVEEGIVWISGTAENPAGGAGAPNSAFSLQNLAEGRYVVENRDDDPITIYHLQVEQDR